MKLHIQGRLFKGGILDAIFARIDGDATKIDIREDELMRQVGENVVTPLRLLEGLIKPVKEVIVTVVPIEDDSLLVDSLLTVQVTVVFADGDTYETSETTLGVASFDLRGVYRELFLSPVESEGGRNYTAVYSAYKNVVIDPFDVPPYVEFEGWSDGGVNRLQGELDTLRFANYWHVQHHQNKWWYAFLMLGGDVVTSGDVFGGERISGPFAVDIPWRLLSDAAKQDVRLIEKVLKTSCAIGDDAAEAF